MPKIMVSIIFLMYRYVFLIREESRTGQVAINSRVFKKSYYTANRKLAYLMGNLLTGQRISINPWRAGGLRVDSILFRRR